MVKLGNTHERADIFTVDLDRFQDSLYRRVVPLECLIVVLLTRSHLPVVLGHPFLELFLAPDHPFQDAFYAIKPFTAVVRHVKSLRPQRRIEDAATAPTDSVQLRRLNISTPDRCGDTEVI